MSTFQVKQNSLHNVSHGLWLINRFGKTGNRELQKLWLGTLFTMLDLFKIYSVSPVILKSINNFDILNVYCLLVFFVVLPIPTSRGFRDIYQFSSFSNKTKLNLKTYCCGSWMSVKLKFRMKFISNLYICFAQRIVLSNIQCVKKNYFQCSFSNRTSFNIRVDY